MAGKTRVHYSVLTPKARVGVSIGVQYLIAAISHAARSIKNAYFKSPFAIRS